MKTETEVGGMHLQAEDHRDCWQPRKPAPKGIQGTVFPLSAFTGSTALPTP